MVNAQNTTMSINESQNLYDNILRNSTNPYIIELLQYEINKRIYDYGDNFGNSWEGKKAKTNILRPRLEFFYKVLKSKSLKGQTNLVLSNAYFTVNNDIGKNKFNVVVPWWSLKKDGTYLRSHKFFRLFKEISQAINKAGINELHSNEFIKKVETFIKVSNELIAANNFSAGVFSNDLGFFERVFIDIFKKQSIPTFIFLHGLPARYNDIDDNRADYLIVWGDKIKENYINAGVDEHKIIVTGHPNYSNPLSKNLKFSLDNVLVISKPTNGAPSISNKMILSDRGNSLLYLKMIQNTLVSYGVDNVKLRLHPSENPQWYREHIDCDFYRLDTNSLNNTLEEASLVIGPTSTVLLEALYSGVNYLVFEPSREGEDLINYPIVSPFDGTDDSIPVAKNQKELKILIDNRICIDQTVLKNYLAPRFDLSEIYKKFK